MFVAGSGAVVERLGNSECSCFDLSPHRERESQTGVRLLFQPWSESTALCSLQVFTYTLSNSVQMMAFPVIAVERLYSIRRPFDKDKHLRRVTWLNGLIWASGVVLSSVVAARFPVTTVSLYCSSSSLSPSGVRLLFNKIYYVSIPLGAACVAVTVGSYSMIVWQIRAQNLRNAGSGGANGEAGAASHTRKRRRAQSYCGYAGIHHLRAASIRMAAGSPQADPRRVSLPLRELGRVARRSLRAGSKGNNNVEEVEMAEVESGRRRRRSRTIGGNVSRSPSARKSTLLLMPSSQSAESQSDVSTENNRSQEAATTEEDLSGGEATASMATAGAIAALTAPIIAITLPDASNQPPRSPVVRKQSGTFLLRAGESTGGSSASIVAGTPIRRCRSAAAAGESMASRSSDADLLRGLRRPTHARLCRSKTDLPVSLSSTLNLRETVGRKRRSEAKTAKKSGYIVLSFLVVWLPLPIAVGISNAHLCCSGQADDPSDLQLYLDVQLGAYCFGMLTAVSNPIIYGLAIRSFRVAFSKLVAQKWNKFKNNSTNSCFS